MIKHFRLIALFSFMTGFVLSSIIYAQSESAIIVSVNLLSMLVSGYFIIRILDDLMGFKG